MSEVERLARQKPVQVPVLILVMPFRSLLHPAFPSPKTSQRIVASISIVSRGCRNGAATVAYPLLMQIISNTGGVFATCSYLVGDETSRRAVLFDAPNDTPGPLLDEARSRGWTIDGLWFTHGHIDHIADHAVVSAAAPEAKLLIHPLDEPKLQQPTSIYPLPFETVGRNADGHLVDDQVLSIGGNIAVRVLHTPGHSPGHVMFYLPDHHVLIGGDLILMNAIGRTDFPDCSFSDLMQSIRRVMALPMQTQLLPGHGHPTTLAEEMAQNPYVKQAMASH